MIKLIKHQRYPAIAACSDRQLTPAKLFCFFFILVITLINSSGCKKFIEVQPPNTSINSENLFTNDATAAAFLTGIYTTMSEESFSNGNFTAMSLLPALSADELTLFDLSNSAHFVYYINSLPKENGDFWNAIYKYVFLANSAIEGLQQHSANLSDTVQKQLLGEAKFIRAFCYFYLVNLYGDVPLSLTTDPKTNRILMRTQNNEVYQQIITDLKDAQTLLNVNFVESDAITKKATTARVRPTRWAASALLARVYLFLSDWSNAELQATSVINHSTLFDLSPLDEVFLANSQEAIWQLQPTGSDIFSNTKEGRLFVLPPTGPDNSQPIYLSNNIMNSFEPGDQRRVAWVDSVIVFNPSGDITYYHPFKYKIGAVNTSTEEYSMVLRIAEQYLIRAEARARLGDPTGAVSDLNAVRQRAGLTVYVGSTSQAPLLSAILHERQVEMFTEWGHRWLDLKRSGNVDAVMSIVTTQKGGTWSPNWALYPIPQYDIDKNPALVGHQNIGY